MRIGLFIFLVSALQTFASNTYSQRTKITLNLTNTELVDVMDQIENQTEFYFLFNEKLIDTDRKVSVSVKDQKIDKVLNDLFAGTDITYTITDRKIILAPSFLSNSAQQQKIVSGTVTDEKGEPVPGVNVVIKGTTRGTITDVDGKYTISDVPDNATLEFSFIGMQPVDVVVGNQSVIDVTMKFASIGLDEVVSIGYGTKKKRDLTGSISSVQGDLITQRNTTQLSQALQGTMSGVMVTRNNDAPGSTATIRIRGITTIGNSNPLIIVDGVPINNINDVNPNDVENISVLKDAASAAIYGARAASGVIVVTTKRAKEGQLNLTYNGEFGFDKPTEWPDYVDAVRFMQFDNEMRWNDNNNTGTEFSTYPEDLINNYWSLNAENPNLYPNTDWYGLIMKNQAARNRQTITISAGTKTVQTQASIIYDNIDGLYDYKSYKRITTRINNNIKINKYLSAEIDLFVKNSKPNDASVNPIYRLHVAAPVYPAQWDDGRVAPGKAGDNIYGYVKYGGYIHRWYNTLGGRGALNFSPLKGLKFSAVVAPVYNFYKGKNFHKAIPTTIYEDPTVSAGYLSGYTSTNLYETRNDDHQITTQLLANYKTTFGNHNLNLLAGYEYYYAFYEFLSASREHYELESFPYLNLGPLEYRDNSGNAYENSYRSYFGRIMYDFNHKYLFQANIRFDGSSRFDEDYRWGNFPSFSGGWVISKESFMSGLQPTLSFLKLRASWGSLGNERIGNYPYQSTISFNNALFYQGSGVVSQQTAAQLQYAIKDISWETTQTFDFGLDAGVFDNKLRLTADYYDKKTKNMLLPLEIPDFMGFKNPSQNTGTMRTKGWEANINWQDQIRDFHYSISFNISDFKSKMGDLGGIEFLGSQVKMEGSEYNEWYGYVSDGLFQTQEEVDNSPKLSSSVKPGDVKYKDISGPEGVPDGIISPDYDRKLLGGSLPRYMYGATIQFDFKGFDFSMIMQGVGKQNSRYSTLMVQPLPENWGNVPAIIDGKYWSHYNTAEQNAKAIYPRLSWSSRGNNYTMSDYWMFNGRYFRFKNIILGYTIPVNLTQKIDIKKVRVYFNVSDLPAFSKYPKGWDPEVSGSGYPITTSFLFGLSVNF